MRVGSLLEAAAKGAVVNSSDWMVQEDHLIALACRESPNSCARWTLRLLTQKMVSWALSRRSVMRPCDKPSRKRTETLEAAVLGIPLQQNATFVCQMKSVLEV